MLQPLFRLKQQVMFTLKFNTPAISGVISVITHWRRGDEIGYQVQTAEKRYWVRERFVQPANRGEAKIAIFAQVYGAPQGEEVKLFLKSRAAVLKANTADTEKTCPAASSK